MRFNVLGPLEVIRDGDPLPLRPRLRLVLAILLLHARTTVSTDRLIDEIWGEEPPATAENTLQVHISQLRRALGSEVLERRPGGYRLVAPPSSIDAEEFEELYAHARAAIAETRLLDARSALAAALDLWSGRALADIDLRAGSRVHAERLDELGAAAFEDRIDVDLALGRHQELVGELRAAVDDHPYRERRRAQLMLALYRAGRQPEALDVYATTRELFVEELGIEPGRELQRLEGEILRHEAELAPRKPAPKRGIPVPPTPLVGREAERDRVAALLSDEGVRLVTLTGPGGIGKTRVALEVAKTVGADFRDGVLFLDFADVSDPALVPAVLAQALAVTPPPDESIDAALEHSLRSQQLLLLLDGFERVQRAGGTISRLLAGAPATKCLVTSRVALHLAGEHELAVPPLRVPAGEQLDGIARSPAVRLFVERATVADREFRLTNANVLAVRDLAIQLEGVPLAIELAAARAKLLPPATMVARLGSRLDLLSDGPADLPSRHQTLRATIGWSYDLLGDDERTLFARLAAFTGGAPLEAAELVGAPDGVDFLSAAQALLDHSLIRRVGELEPRLVMLDSVREYALERLAESGAADAARAAHAAYYRALAERAAEHARGSPEPVWLRRLETEQPNLRAALETLLQSDHRGALRLAAALQRFWRVAGLLAEGRRLLEQVIAQVEPVPSPELVRVLNGLGAIAGEQGDLAASRTALEQSLEYARALGEPTLVAPVLSNLGNLALYGDDLPRARALYGESLAEWSAAGDAGGEAVTREDLAIVLAGSGEGDPAIVELERSIALARTAGDAYQTAASLRTLARTLVSLDRLEEGIAAARQAIQLEPGTKHPGLADALELAAGLAGATGDAATLTQLLGAADALRDALGASRAPDRTRWHDEWRALAYAQLGDVVFGEHFAAGATLQPEAALGTAIAAVDAAAGAEAASERASDRDLQRERAVRP